MKSCTTCYYRGNLYSQCYECDAFNHWQDKTILNKEDLDYLLYDKSRESVHEDKSYPAIWDLVISDMKERDRIGQESYNTRLKPFNGRNALWEAYEESLDLCVYLRQAIYEQENENVG